SFPALPPTCTSTLSLHDALPIWLRSSAAKQRPRPPPMSARLPWSRSTVTDPAVGRKKDSTPRISMLHLGVCPTYGAMVGYEGGRSEEHTSELQSRENLVCRLLPE